MKLKITDFDFPKGESNCRAYVDRAESGKAIPIKTISLKRHNQTILDINKAHFFEIEKLRKEIAALKK